MAAPVIDVRLHSPADSATVLAIGFGERPDLDGLPSSVLPASARTAFEAFLGDAPALKVGEVRTLAQPTERPSRILALGLGAGRPSDLRRAGATLARAADADTVALAVPGVDGAGLSALVEGLVLGIHRYHLKTKPRKSKPGTVTLIGVTDEAALTRGLDSARAVAWVRDLVNTPTSTKTPQWLAQQALDELGPLGIDVVVRDERWLAENGFGGVLAVGAGSASPPRLVHATWRPRGAPAAPHAVIVGKGIVFDTGGLNLKPGASMRTMKSDIGGGAAALGALRLVALRKLPVRVSVLVPIAENSLSGSAMRPSDVIRHYGGLTSEVQNTDAEGRLVLADALAYAVARLRPTALVDIATLTGAMMVALGNRMAGILSTSDELAAALSRSGEAVDEPLWRLPLVDEYEPQLDSEVADIQNAPGNPGGITAALFLRHFVGDVAWAHLDIAGPSWANGDSGVNTKGGTGFGARLLADWVEQL